MSTPEADTAAADVLRLHGEGIGRNAIARRLSLSRRRVSAIVADAGLTFERAASTSTATAARSADSRGRRDALLDGILAQSAVELERLSTLTAPTDDLSAERSARTLAQLAQTVGVAHRVSPPDPTGAEHVEAAAVFGGFLTRLQATLPAEEPPGTSADL